VEFAFESKEYTVFNEVIGAHSRRGDGSPLLSGGSPCTLHCIVAVVFTCTLASDSSLPHSSAQKIQ